MLIQKKNLSTPLPSEITDEELYLKRRSFLKGGALAALSTTALWQSQQALAALDVKGYKPSAYVTADEELTSFKDASSYNNFYEFGTGKNDPVKNAQNFDTSDWSIEFAGHCKRPGKVALEDLIKPLELEERIYRHRCVEAWSMVIPWLGVPLSRLLEHAEPTANAKFVAFYTLNDPKRMVGQNRRVLDWPYREGLRMDEAMHPLTLMTVGMYGKTLPNQNGAPVRLIVPWKYGFKAIKSIVKIEFVEKQPYTTWNDQNPREYGFYSNVNPTVSHPRWSQARERRIGEFFKRDTLMFNGYAEEVAHLYQGMDLKKFI